MLKYVLTAVIAIGSAGVAHASTIDLSDGVFSNQTYQGTGLPIDSFQEVSDGITFTFSTSGQFRSIGPWQNGFDAAGPNYRIGLGGGSGSPHSFTLMASEDVTLGAFWGLGQQYNTNPVFDVTGTGVSSTNNTFGTTGFIGSATPASNSFVGGPLGLLANTLYTFNVTNSGLTTQGYITSFDFTSSVSAVPLPAGLPLLLGGLGMLGAVSRLRRKT